MQKKTKKQKAKQSWGAGKFLQLFTKSTDKKMKRCIVEIVFFFDWHTYSHTHQSACKYTHTYAHTHIHIYIEWEKQKLADVPTERTVTQTRTQPQHFIWNMCHVYFAIFQKHNTKVCIERFKQLRKEQGRRIDACREAAWAKTAATTSDRPDRELGRRSRTVYGKSWVRCRNSVTQP